MAKFTHKIEIPENIIEIECYTFDGCTSLTSVVIPKGVREIGDRAFKGCTSLISITISSIF